MRVTDKGSRPQCVKLQVQEVPAYGIIDSGADITIMGGMLFKKVAAVARFKKRDLKRPDKTLRNYDHTPFTLDGRIDMDILFDGKTMFTPVYIKADANDQLLLSEGVCHQLGILQYHTEVEPWRGGRKGKQSSPKMAVTGPTALTARSVPEESLQSNTDTAVGVPTVRVRLLQSVKLLSHQGAVEVEGSDHLQKPQTLLLESSHNAPLCVQDALLQVQQGQPTFVYTSVQSCRLLMSC